MKNILLCLLIANATKDHSTSLYLNRQLISQNIRNKKKYYACLIIAGVAAVYLYTNFHAQLMSKMQMSDTLHTYFHAISDSEESMSKTQMANTRVYIQALSTFSTHTLSQEYKKRSDTLQDNIIKLLKELKNPEKITTMYTQKNFLQECESVIFDIDKALKNIDSNTSDSDQRRERAILQHIYLILGYIYSSCKGAIDPNIQKSQLTFNMDMRYVLYDTDSIEKLLSNKSLFLQPSLIAHQLRILHLYHELLLIHNPYSPLIKLFKNIMNHMPYIFTMIETISAIKDACLIDKHDKGFTVDFSKSTDCFIALVSQMFSEIRDNRDVPGISFSKNKLQNNCKDLIGTTIRFLAQYLIFEDLLHSLDVLQQKHIIFVNVVFSKEQLPFIFKSTKTPNADAIPIPQMALQYYVNQHNSLIWIESEKGYLESTPCQAGEYITQDDAIKRASGIQVLPDKQKSCMFIDIIRK